MISEQIMSYLQYNPFYHLIEVFRSLIYQDFNFNLHFKITLIIYLLLRLINYFISDKLISNINIHS